MQLKLGVNVDHVATLRQARGTYYPCPLEAARLAMRAGAHGITVHLREDRRHIQDADVEAIHADAELPMNLEMGAHPEIVEKALRLAPEEVCLVPEKREELTTEGGLDVAGQIDSLRPVVQAMAENGIMVSLFIEADRKQLEAAAELRVPYVELHTGTYCDAGDADRPALLDQLIDGARFGHTLGIRINAGHGINMENIDGILRIPHLDTLNIGHSIIARAVFVGMREAVRELLDAMAAYAGGDAA